MSKIFAWLKRHMVILTVLWWQAAPLNVFLMKLLTCHVFWSVRRHTDREKDEFVKYSNHFFNKNMLCLYFFDSYDAMAITWIEIIIKISLQYIFRYDIFKHRWYTPFYGFLKKEIKKYVPKNSRSFFCFKIWNNTALLSSVYIAKNKADYMCTSCQTYVRNILRWFIDYSNAGHLLNDLLKIYYRSNNCWVFRQS